jgi:hypothetical protein
LFWQSEFQQMVNASSCWEVGNSIILWLASCWVAAKIEWIWKRSVTFRAVNQLAWVLPDISFPLEALSCLCSIPQVAGLILYFFPFDAIIPCLS